MLITALQLSSCYKSSYPNILGELPSNALEIKTSDITFESDSGREVDPEYAQMGVKLI